MKIIKVTDDSNSLINLSSKVIESYKQNGMFDNPLTLDDGTKVVMKAIPRKADINGVMKVDLTNEQIEYFLTKRIEQVHGGNFDGVLTQIELNGEEIHVLVAVLSEQYKEID